MDRTKIFRPEALTSSRRWQAPGHLIKLPFRWTSLSFFLLILALLALIAGLFVVSVESKVLGTVLSDDRGTPSLIVSTSVQDVLKPESTVLLSQHPLLQETPFRVVTYRSPAEEELPPSALSLSEEVLVLEVEPLQESQAALPFHRFDRVDLRFETSLGTMLSSAAKHMVIGRQ